MPRRWLAWSFAVSAVFAVLVAIFSTDSVHRLWGTMAACGYALALLALAAVRAPNTAGNTAGKTTGLDLALALSFCGALLVPLAWMAAHALEQPEVAVVARSGLLLLHHGSPYVDWSSLARTGDPNAYNPYLPLMAVFGLPRAIAGSGPMTDPRIWFGAVFLAVFWFALRGCGVRNPWRWAAGVAASPVIAFELAVGGTDVPMVGFLCLGFALLVQARTRPVLAGFALGIAAAMKATAWPAVAVAIALIAARDGKRQAGVFTLTALAVVVACLGPFAAPPKALVENTIMFPLGLASVKSAATSPLPGHLIAGTGHLGHTVIVTALAAAGIAVAASLVFRPPRTVPRAVLFLAGAMTLMFLLAPSTRFGYFIYPGTLALWLLAVSTAPSVQVQCAGTGTPSQVAGLQWGPCGYDGEAARCQRMRSVLGRRPRPFRKNRKRLPWGGPPPPCSRYR
jgi:hypothetical protein